MESKDKLVLYKGILLGRSGNSLAARFKLMRVVRDNDVNNLYAGVRLDDVRIREFESGDILKCDWSDSLIFTPNRGEETVFRHNQEDGYYYDVFDEDVCCELINDDSVSVDIEHGCCNLRSLNDESVISNASVKIKRR